MPYRIDFSDPPEDALDRLVALGALDVEQSAVGFAALLPDAVTVEEVRLALGSDAMSVSPAKGRDDESVWILTLRPLRVGSCVIQLSDGDAFGTGLHPTTALCLEALDDFCAAAIPESVLDIGTGSGVLAIAALLKGVPKAVGLDTDPVALEMARTNATLNGVANRLRLVAGAPEDVTGSWPLVFANVLAAPLMEMAPVVVRRVGHGGRLVLSGIPTSVAREVGRAYQHLGMRPVQTTTRAGWAALMLHATW